MKILQQLEDFYFYLLHKVYKTTFRFSELSFPELKSKNDVFEKIYDKKLDGAIIKNFLSDKEVETFFKNLNACKNNLTQKNNLDFGYTLGTSFQETGDDLKKYYNHVGKVNEEINDLFGFDFNERLIKTFEKLTEQDIPVAVASSETGEDYLCTTIRFMEPGKGGLPVHVHLGFFDSGYKQPNMVKLKQIIDLAGELSFFIPLQYSESGGELKLFDLYYENVPAPLKKLHFDHPKVSRFVNNRKIQLLKPNIGEMIIFNGGSIWHRVEPINGTKSRITIGGFANFATGRNKIILWS